ncbi:MULTISPECIES: baseplate J/gp47 family protein [Streptosporangium]|uniref:Phage protein gp47/JayE n=1 Tax=Streptosporangium brasiliense TaxID=47480 RepID=A0ABT9RME1_9ACTN|nr:baseplate J/gp47 family protein [Streptosporangium brasiliense]MDP9870462.1 putative phage protein gp47/JayE [Streptosporangium brasiliense]
MADETLAEIGYTVPEVSLDYTARDYDAVLAELVRRGRQVIPEWVANGEGDFVMMLAEIMASSTDLNNLYIDRVLGESVLATATQRASVLALAEQIGYITHGTIAATGSVTLTSDATTTAAITVPKGTTLLTDYIEDLDAPIVFETDSDVVVPAAGGTINAAITQGQTVNRYEAGEGTGRAGLSVRIPHQGVIEGSVRVWVQAPHADIEWVRVNRAVDAAPQDRVFLVRLRADGTTSVIFGNGINGYVPELGAKIFLSYRVGVGRAGNLPAGKIGQLVSNTVTGVLVALDAASKPLSTATLGGSDPEDNDEIRRNAPHAFAAQRRCVTLLDFSRLALEVPGVSAAKAVSARTSSVTVFLAGPDRSTPNTTLLDAVQARLKAAALSGVAVSVSSPTFVPVNFGTDINPLRIFVAPGWRDTQVKAAVQTQLAALFKAADMTFGTRVTLSKIYTTLASLPGVININIPVMARSDAPQAGADDAVMKDYEMPVLGVVKLATTGGVITPV